MNLTADANSTSLALTWQRPDGDLDALVVKLTTNRSDLWRSTLPPDATEVTVDGLTQGSTYELVMVSRSGNLTNQSEHTFRTGELLPLLSLLS